MEQKTRMSMDQIPFDKLEKVGINRDLIQKMEKQEMTDFLNGFRSDKLYTVNAKINGEDYKIPAKIRLQSKEDGSVDIKVHPIQRLNVPDEYMGHKFTREEKGALLGDKNLGKTLELTGRDGKKDNYYLSIDPKTNELIPLRSSYIQIPDKIKGTNLSLEQKEKLASGEKSNRGRNDGEKRQEVFGHPSGGCGQPEHWLLTIQTGEIRRLKNRCQAVRKTRGQTKSQLR